MGVVREFRSSKQPLRTCIGCRQTAPQSTLIRMVATNYAGQWRISIDEKRRLPGRGAWLHFDQNCINQAIRRRAFNRALRIPGPVETAELLEWFSNVHTNVSVNRTRKREEKPMDPR